VLRRFPVPLRRALLHSLNNATVCTKLRGASRLGKRRKAVQDPVGGRYSGFARTQALLSARRQNRSRCSSGIRKPVDPCIAPWQQGRRSRDGRGVGREPPNGLKSEESTRRSGSQVSAKAAGAGHHTQYCARLQARRGGWLLRAYFFWSIPLDGSACLPREAHSKFIRLRCSLMRNTIK
jgi:hypothetical protein